MEKYDKEDQGLLAIWAADCAERVLPIFERACPKDDRPRKAVDACRTWARRGAFRMAIIRQASLAAHAAAREAKENRAACFAAHAAGQAVATAHVPQHAFGAAYYALRAVTAAQPANAEAQIAQELHWQSRRLPKDLKRGWQDWQSRRLPKNLRQVWRDVFTGSEKGYGKVIRIQAKQVRAAGRASQGVRLISLENGDKICSVAKAEES